MPDFSGKFQYLNAGGSVSQQGACRVQFDEEKFTLTPESGAPMTFDLGDLNAVVAADWELGLPLYTGSSIVLRQFGKSFETLGHDLLEAFRKRAIQCLLLEDLEELKRFPGNFELLQAGTAPRSGPAEIRLFKSNLAVLPAASQSFQWRLSDIDSINFDSSAYEVVLQSGEDRLKLTRLAKRTEEFVSKLREAVGDLATRSAQALHAIFPFLDPDQLQATAGLLREGQSASVAKLAAIHSKIPTALAAHAVDKDLKPYYDDLLARTAVGSLYAGFKLVRPEDEEASSEGAQDSDTGDGPQTAEPQDTSASSLSDDDPGSNAPDADENAPEVLYWFFFPIASKTGGTQPGNVVAWEASSRAGRATYFFRVPGPARAAQLKDAATGPAVLEAGIRRLNRVLGMLNFRRRPIYLSDGDLDMDPRYHRYAIAARRLPDLREVRASFLGRAIHSSHEAWQKQVDSILSKAGL